MPAGGKRPGAGRPRGVTAGTKHERLEKMLGKGTKTPLQYMLNILNDKKTSPEKKMWAAEKAAPEPLEADNGQPWDNRAGTDAARAAAEKIPAAQ